MKYISWIISVPLALLLVVFAVSNRSDISLTLWPFSYTIDIPVYMFAFAMIFLGVLWGGLSTWLNGHQARHMARIKSREADLATMENNRLKEHVNRQKEASNSQAVSVRP